MAAWEADAMTSTSTDPAKRLAKLLREDLTAAGFDIPHSLALELVAHQVGAKDWNLLAAEVRRGAPAIAPEVGAGVPVLRVMSMAKALPFYLDYLGFALDWEHRFEPGMPLYAQAPGGPTLQVIDPYGNVLRFAQPSPAR